MKQQQGGVEGAQREQESAFWQTGSEIFTCFKAQEFTEIP